MDFISLADLWFNRESQKGPGAARKTNTPNSKWTSELWVTSDSDHIPMGSRWNNFKSHEIQTSSRYLKYVVRVVEIPTSSKNPQL